MNPYLQLQEDTKQHLVKPAQLSHSTVQRLTFTTCKLHRKKLYLQSLASQKPLTYSMAKVVHFLLHSTKQV